MTLSCVSYEVFEGVSIGNYTKDKEYNLKWEKIEYYYFNLLCLNKKGQRQ